MTYNEMATVHNRAASMEPYALASQNQRLLRILRDLVNAPAIVHAVNPSGQRHTANCECAYCLALCEVYGKPERPAQQRGESQ